MERKDSTHLFNFVCDLETSGSDPIRNGVISATILVCDLHLNVIHEITKKVCPPDLSPSTWSLGAQNAHGKTIAEVMKHMPNDQFCYELLCELAPYKHPDNFPQPFICHASPKGKPELKMKNGKMKPTGTWDIWPWFDFFFLEWCFRKAYFANGQEMVWSFWKLFNNSNLVSTVQMGRDAKYKSNGLKVWAERIGFQLNHHDDRSDAYCCLEVLKYLRGTYA